MVCVVEVGLLFGDLVVDTRFMSPGFAGGHDISRNVGFNLVRETEDHGGKLAQWRGRDTL